MPELPEVETIRRVLEPMVAGKKILSLQVLNPQVIAWPSAEEFCNKLQGRTISGMRRRGKFLQMELENGDRVVFHLRMTGHPRLSDEDEPLNKHTHLILNIEGGMQFRYEDLRRFGRFWLLSGQESDEITGMDRLGIEPESPELTAGYLREHLAKRKMRIKEALLDQSVVCGIGNIYSDEILFVAKIHPEKRCDLLSDGEWEDLARAIPEVIGQWIGLETSSPGGYFAGTGNEGGDGELWKAYGREGKPCTVCGTQMERIKIGGRSSTYCPACQKRTEPE